ncbi:hypothetical protein Nepgr_026102 [Nepenthes gracilis]|uniref:RNA helicase n=1 Tax=Nepenthes gracilis TaxID=150966 RepID=A0AAD3T8B6_NEPGR|nr:hypothetical protein Nepgr_026102 [Nepenthes gracilis]
MAKPIENVGIGSRSLRAIMSRSSNACLLDKIGSLDSAGRRAMQTHLRETLGSVAYIYSAAADANTSNCPIQANEGHGSDAFNEEATKPGWSIYGRNFLVSYRGLKIPRPMESWAEVGLSSELLEAVERAGLKNPYPPEMATVPLWLHCRDVICISENRFSKTAAFILPLLIYISRQPHLNEESRPRGPYALVMAPYRYNLVLIEELIKNFFCMNIKVFSVTPGQNF